MQHKHLSSPSDFLPLSPLPFFFQLSCCTCQLPTLKYLGHISQQRKSSQHILPQSLALLTLQLLDSEISRFLVCVWGGGSFQLQEPQLPPISLDIISFSFSRVGELPVLRVILVSPVRVLPVPKAVSLMQATPHKQTCSPELSSLFISFLALQLIRQYFCPLWKDSLTRTLQQDRHCCYSSQEHSWALDFRG